MRKTLGFVTLCVWAVLASAADPGGQPGFVKAVFTATTFDTGSDVFANATTWVLAPEEMYADDLDPKTTVAYGGYMRMEQGVRYDFRGCYSNSVAVKIDSRLIVSGSKEACARLSAQNSHSCLRPALPPPPRLAHGQADVHSIDCAVGCGLMARRLRHVLARLPPLA